MQKLKDYVNKELELLDRSIVATPKSREDLDYFANTTKENFVLLTQMAVQYGYKLALHNVLNKTMLNNKN
ncbi:MAG: hypothetical protein ABF265_07815 [Polaribacter sp.]